MITDSVVNQKEEILETKKKQKNNMKKNSEDSSFTFLFKNGKIKFDLQQAKNLPIDSDLRNLKNLWSGKKKDHYYHLTIKSKSLYKKIIQNEI